MAQAPMPTEAPKPKSRTMLYAIVIIVLIGVGGAVYYLTRPSGGPPPGMQIAIWDTSGACLQSASPPDCGFNTIANPNVTISAGTTIQWINNGGQDHTATSCDQAKASAFPGACPFINAASLTIFNSGSVAKSGGTWPTSSPYQTLSAGTYYYFCYIHIWMHGKIVVQ